MRKIRLEIAAYCSLPSGASRLLLVNALLLFIAGSAFAGTNSSQTTRLSTFRSEIATEMLALVNRVRAVGRICGDRKFPAAAPLQWNDALAVAALMHAEDMARNDYFDHNSKNGTSTVDRVLQTGYDYRRVGENLAETTDVRNAVELWVETPGHCSNLMNPDFSEMGAAYAVGSANIKETRWVQLIGKRR